MPEEGDAGAGPGIGTAPEAGPGMGEVVDGDYRMFRRAKLHLDQFEPADVDGRVVEGRLGLTDGKGHPLCASVRAPLIVWSMS